MYLPILICLSLGLRRGELSTEVEACSNLVYQVIKLFFKEEPK